MTSVFVCLLVLCCFFRGIQHVYFAEFMLTVAYNGDIDRIQNKTETFGIKMLTRQNSQLS